MTDTFVSVGRVAPLAPERPFLERLQAHGAKRPDAPALTEGSTTLTYGLLLSAVEASAEQWRERRIGPGDLVGVLSKRSLPSVVEILGLLAIGAAYVPFDRAGPLERLRFQIDDSLVRGVLIEAPEAFRWDPMLGSTRRWNVSPVPHGRHHPGRRDRSVEWVDPSIDPTNLAYVIYTSGSTGRPKGVGVSRASLDALLDAWDRVMGPVRHVSLLSSSLSFDASVAELFWPLAAGGRLVVAPDGPANERAGAGFTLSFGKLIRDRRITHVQCTPTRASLMLADADDRAALARLDHLVIGGEALTAALAKELLSTGLRRLTNAYGPTECTVWASAHDVVADDLVGEVDERPLPIGLPLARTMLDIVDASGASVDDDVRGELLIGGPLVAEGYVARPELTQERFVRHDFPDGTRCAAYRTGDVAWRRADGRIVVSGRNDQQVKIRGQRVELGEIEASLASEPGVRLCVAALVERHGRACVVAAVSGDDFDDSAVRGALAARLPDVMVPELIVPFASFPTLTSGKIDRAEVRSLLSAAVRRHDDAILARLAESDAGLVGGDRRRDSPLRAMVSDFASVLGRGGVTPDSDFFLLGGHSLAAVELVSRIEARTGQRLSIRALLSAGTPRALVAWQANGPERSDRVLVKLTGGSLPSGDVRTLFLIHGAGGNVLRFRPLANAVRDAVCIVGVQAPAAEGGQLDVNVGAMVRRYVDAIVESDPTGVYEVGGYSSGAIVSLLVAEELIRRGHRVRSLVLIDPVESEALATGIRGRMRALRENTAPLDGISRRARVSASVEGWRRRKDWDEAGSKALIQLGFADLFTHFARIVKDARVGSIDAPALLVRSSVENPFRTRRYDLALSVPRTVRTAWVRSKHDELLHAPSIPAIAEAVDGYLRSV